MIKLSIFLVLLLCFSSPAYAGSTSTPQQHRLFQEENWTDDQKEELAKQIGIVLIDMTKDDVKDIFSLLKPEIWYTPDGQEVWFFKSPEPQNIYFKDDKVEKVEYGPKLKIKQPVEM